MSMDVILLLRISTGRNDDPELYEVELVDRTLEAWLLHKLHGSRQGAVYHVCGYRCDCPSAYFRGRPCKHVQALAEKGLLPALPQADKERGPGAAVTRRGPPGECGKRVIGIIGEGKQNGHVVA